MPSFLLLHQKGKTAGWKDGKSLFGKYTLMFSLQFELQLPNGQVPGNILKKYFKPDLIFTETKNE